MHIVESYYNKLHEETLAEGLLSINAGKIDFEDSECSYSTRAIAWISGDEVPEELAQKLISMAQAEYGDEYVNLDCIGFSVVLGADDDTGRIDDEGSFETWVTVIDADYWEEEDLYDEIGADVFAKYYDIPRIENILTNAATEHLEGWIHEFDSDYYDPDDTDNVYDGIALDKLDWELIGI